ncbi:MAG: hypothetical protein AAFU79_11775 [Myxococcota bacterium]
MNCPICGSKGTALPAHPFLSDGYQCSNPRCQEIYMLSPEEAARQKADRQARQHMPAPPAFEVRAPSY